MEAGDRFGAYVLREKIAQGGMAEIFYAERLGAMSFRRPVCIKRIRPTLSADSSFVQMFIDEAHTTSKLRHSNIVAVEDFGSEGGQLFLCMEWIHGLDAARLLREVDRSGAMLPVDAALYIVGEVLKALEYAHRKMDGGKPLAIVHRDVSPHNVMVSFAGEVKLTDFGIAKATSRLHQTQGDLVKGKIAYMAPEQAVGAVLDGRADLFAVGVMAFELLTGRRPFTGKELELVQALLRGERPTVRQLRPEVSPEVEAFVDGLLQVQRDRRFADASHALEALGALPVAGGGRALQRVIAGLYPDQVSVVAPTVRAASPPQGVAPAQGVEATVPSPAWSPALAETGLSAPRANNEPTRTAAAAVAPGPSLQGGAAAPTRSRAVVYVAVVLATMAVTTVGVVAAVKLSRGGQAVAAAPTAGEGASGTVVVVMPRDAGATVQGAAGDAADAGRAGVAAAVDAGRAVAGGADAGVDAGPRAAAPQWALVAFRVRPWGDVRVDGRRVGSEPVRLRPGAHEVVVTQGAREIRRRVVVQPGETGTRLLDVTGR